MTDPLTTNKAFISDLLDALRTSEPDEMDQAARAIGSHLADTSASDFRAWRLALKKMMEPGAVDQFCAGFLQALEMIFRGFEMRRESLNNSSSDHDKKIAVELPTDFLGNTVSPHVVSELVRRAVFETHPVVCPHHILTWCYAFRDKPDLMVALKATSFFIRYIWEHKDDIDPDTNQSIIP